MPRSTPQELTAAMVAEEISKFLDGRDGPYEWDDFCTLRIADQRLDVIRQRCRDLPVEFPAEISGQYCGPEGYLVLQTFLEELRTHEHASATTTPGRRTA